MSLTEVPVACESVSRERAMQVALHICNHFDLPESQVNQARELSSRIEGIGQFLPECLREIGLGDIVDQL